jgi:hypothetical protein
MSQHHFLSFMEKDSWVIKIERIKKLFNQILSHRGTRRVVKLMEVTQLLDSLVPDMDVWYAERCNVTIDFRKKVAELRAEILDLESENQILQANLKDSVSGYKTLQTLIRKELPSMEEPDFSFLDNLTISQEEDVAGTKQ